MKNLTLAILTFSLMFISCSYETVNEDVLTNQQNSQNQTGGNQTGGNGTGGNGTGGNGTGGNGTGGMISGYAMTAKINGATFQANDPYGNNLFSPTNILMYFPSSEYIALQGRQGGLFGNPEINIWLKKSQMVVGSYAIGKETFDTPPSHFIDLNDGSNQMAEYTIEGNIIITEKNTSTKIIKGTFNFKTSNEVNSNNPIINYNVTEGTFNYKYEN